MIQVSGAGPVGLAFALFAHGQGLPVTIVEAKSHDAWLRDLANSPRSVALAHGSRQLLERVDAWRGLSGAPLQTIHVQQSQAFGHTVIRHSDVGAPALGTVLRLGPLTQALAHEVTARGIGIDYGITSAASDALCVQAEGAPHNITLIKEYLQSAVVADVTVSAPQVGEAFEYFTAHGPLALLPLPDADGSQADQMSLVWCCAHAESARLAALDETTFLRELQAAFGDRLGQFTDAHARAVFPLRLVRGTPATPGVIALGNAAQSLHPVAGQGLNLGLRDAFECAALLAAAQDRLLPGEQFNAATLASAFEQARARDRDETVRLTDSYVGLFSNELMPLAWARGLGLNALNTLDPLRRLVAGRMMHGVRSAHPPADPATRPPELVRQIGTLWQRMRQQMRQTGSAR